MEQNVFRLEVPVDDVMAVHELHCSAHLPHPSLHRLLCNLTNILQALIQIATQTRLQDHIGAIIIHEEVIKSHHMRVHQKCLDLHLANKLLHGGVIQSMTIDRLDGVYHVIVVTLSKVNLAVLALVEIFEHSEL
jgi:hypothetical protein